ncbi:MAG: hypothetical protein ACLQDY_12815 [Streptosporangiaceae bacterium]
MTDALTIRPGRQDVPDADAENDELCFEIMPGSGVELVVKWGDGPRQQRVYLITSADALDLRDHLDQLTDD